ncbi:Hypothetical predicted protein [Marmota monax]|uniref:Uncharacterized protein n=1 Tax=Marmota monax TaxID=9995 RepID=A0A5E4ASS2_MARMO|nr:Hypothetical predicted protein [Marmota monax]
MCMVEAAWSPETTAGQQHSAESSGPCAYTRAAASKVPGSPWWVGAVEPECRSLPAACQGVENLCERFVHRLFLLTQLLLKLLLDSLTWLLTPRLQGIRGSPSPAKDVECKEEGTWKILDIAEQL